jgi:hypothetical protein
MDCSEGHLQRTRSVVSVVWRRIGALLSLRNSARALDNLCLVTRRRGPVHSKRLGQSIGLLDRKGRSSFHR